jgi:hypothetical protein
MMSWEEYTEVQYRDDVEVHDQNDKKGGACVIVNLLYELASGSEDAPA